MPSGGPRERDERVASLLEEARGCDHLDGADRAIKEALELNPADAGIWFTRGKLHEQHEDLGRAVEYYDQACAMDGQQKEYPKASARAKERLKLQELKEKLKEKLKRRFRQGAAPGPEDPVKEAAPALPDRGEEEAEATAAEAQEPAADEEQAAVEPAAARQVEPDETRKLRLPRVVAVRGRPLPRDDVKTRILGEDDLTEAPPPEGRYHKGETAMLEVSAEERAAEGQRRIQRVTRDHRVISEVLWTPGAVGPAPGVINVFDDVTRVAGQEDDVDLMETMKDPSRQAVAAELLETVPEPAGEVKEQLARMLQRAESGTGESGQEAAEDGALSARAQGLLELVERGQASAVMKACFGPRDRRPPLDRQERALVTASAMVALSRQLLQRVPHAAGKVGEQLDALRHTLGITTKKESDA